MQNNHPIAFYSRKLNPAQTRYTTTERELLAIVETLKEFRNILLGQQIRVFTDHQNLTYKAFNTERVMQWRLLIEEYGPELIYVPGKHNIVADALSRLNLNPVTSPKDMDHIAQLYALDKEDYSNVNPVQFSIIDREQTNDKTLLSHIKSGSSGYHLKVFRGGGKNWELICYNGKIAIPSALQKRVADFYHLLLGHPGMERTELTLRQHYWWKSLRTDVQSLCSKCLICQKTK